MHRNMQIQKFNYVILVISSLKRRSFLLKVFSFGHKIKLYVILILGPSKQCDFTFYSGWNMYIEVYTPQSGKVLFILIQPNH